MRTHRVRDHTAKERIRVASDHIDLATSFPQNLPQEGPSYAVQTIDNDMKVGAPNGAHINLSQQSRRKVTEHRVGIENLRFHNLSKVRSRYQAAVLYRGLEVSSRGHTWSHFQFNPVPVEGIMAGRNNYRSQKALLAYNKVSHRGR